MAAVRQQQLIEAPVGRIWELLTDPATYTSWAGDAVEVTGVPTKVEQGSTFIKRGPTPFGGEKTTTFEVEELDDLHEIRLRCQSSGYYSHWRLTEARGETFTDVEIGVEPIGVQGRVASLLWTKSQLRDVIDRSLEGLRRVSTGGPKPKPEPETEPE